MTRFVSIGLITLLVGLALAACSRPAASSLFIQTGAASPAAQIEVLHGDVLVVDGRDLRLADETTPQPAPDAHCAAEAVAARQAELRLRDLVRQVRSVDVRPVGGLDDHGRAFARVFLDGVDPATTLIDEGLAVAPQPGGFDWCGASGATAPAAQHIAMLSFLGR